MKKLSDYHFTNEQIRVFYERNRGPINYFCGESKEADLLSCKDHSKNITQLVKIELRRVQDFKGQYSYLSNLLSRCFTPPLDYIFMHKDDYQFFDEEYDLKSNMDSILEAAKTNVGLLTWLPEHYRCDPTVLLTAYFSNKSSFMGLAAYFDTTSFSYICEDLWDGNYYDGQQLSALEELIRSHLQNYLIYRP